mmetsp:Transcript_26943/g.70897  ORF Transcript_26943/g.70897 Transcript_26943/m.70897 type:complete len:216 (-) Transcript_26943:282-929(-)
MGVPPAPRYPPLHSSDPPGQGQEVGLQGQAGIRCLPCPCSPWQPQEARSQGHCQWQAQVCRCHQQRDLPPLPPQPCRGARRPSLRQSARAQLVLGRHRWHVQVLRGDLGRSFPPRDPQRSAHQLDLQRHHEAPRDARPHRCRPQGSRRGQGPRQPSLHALASCCLEEAQLGVFPALPINVALGGAEPLIFFLHEIINQNCHLTDGPLGYFLCFVA